MAIHQSKKLMGWTVRGQRVSRRVIAVEPVIAIFIRSELATEVVGRLVLRVLEVIFAVGAGLPDVKDGSGDGLASDKVSDGAVHLAHSALGIGILNDGGAVVTERSVGRPEGSEDGG